VSIAVRPVATPQEPAEWVRFPRLSIYPATSLWVPPADRDVVRSLDRSANPFFQHGDAIPLLARGSDGQPVGRILAQVYHRHNERHGERTATSSCCTHRAMGKRTS
jgi:hypothetical protein